MQRLLTRRELLTAELFLSTCTAHGTPTLLGVLSVLHASANHEAGGTHGPLIGNRREAWHVFPSASTPPRII